MTSEAVLTELFHLLGGNLVDLGQFRIRNRRKFEWA